MILRFCIIFMFIFGYAKDFSFKTLKSNFIQTITTGNKTLKYTGTLYVKAPNKALWEYKEPFEKKIFVSSNTTIVYEPIIEQATIISTSKTVDFLHILSNIQKNASKNNTYSLSLYNISYAIKADKNKNIKSISYKDTFGNPVKIVLMDTKKNLTIANSIFEFKPKEHIDIIYGAD